MKKDPFSLFIEDSVLYASNKYYELIFKTKTLFFDYLNKGKSFEDFKKASSKIWENVDHSFMNERIKELEEMIEARDLKDRKILNPNAEFTQIYELVKESRFNEVERLYKNTIDQYYKGRLNTVKKDYVDKQSYLAKIVEQYDKAQAVIPYYNKDGTVRSYHNIASYNSMLYNVNLNRSGWNRTMYDASLLNNDLVYLPAHPFACDLCMPWQGKVYSTSGKSLKYPPKELAEAGGIGHPNCKHQWLLYWGEDMIQKDDYNSIEWQDAYERKQKIQALQLERKKLKNDRKIYENIESFGEVDKVNQKISSINSKIKELK